MIFIYVIVGFIIFCYEIWVGNRWAKWDKGSFRPLVIELCIEIIILLIIGGICLLYNNPPVKVKVSIEMVSWWTGIVTIPKSVGWFLWRKKKEIEVAEIINLLKHLTDKTEGCFFF